MKIYTWVVPHQIPGMMVTEGLSELERLGQDMPEVHPPVEQTLDPADADLIIATTFGTEEDAVYLASRFPKKTVILDYQDGPDDYVVEPTTVHRYFKRSYCTAKKEDGSRHSAEPGTGNVWPMPYGVIGQYVRLNCASKPGSIRPHAGRDIHLACFLRPIAGKWRKRMLDWTADLIEDTGYPSHHLGEVDSTRPAFRDGRGGRQGISVGYHRKLSDTRIVVSCQPDGWEGDQRTWETLASGCLLCVDRIYAPDDHPLIDGEHCLVYDTNASGLEHLRERIMYYLRHPEDAERIAINGFKYAMEHHTSAQRMRYVIERSRL